MQIKKESGGGGAGRLGGLRGGPARAKMLTASEGGRAHKSGAGAVVKKEEKSLKYC